MLRVTKVFRYHRVLKRAGIAHASRDLVKPSTGEVVISSAEVDTTIATLRTVAVDAVSRNTPSSAGATGLSPAMSAPSTTTAAAASGSSSASSPSRDQPATATPPAPEDDHANSPSACMLFHIAVAFIY